MNIATVAFEFTAAFVARFKAHADLPTAGRAAIIINCPSCNPVVILSILSHPVDNPVISPSCVDNFSRFALAELTTSFIVLNSLVLLLLTTFNIFLSASSKTVLISTDVS